MSTDQHATLTSAAEAKIQAIIDSKDLYCATSSHEKTLLRLVRNLSHYVADNEPSVILTKAEFWPTFRHWVLENRSLANSHACAFISKYIQTKGHQKSVGHTIGLYVSIFKVWGISLTPVILEQIKVLGRDFERFKKSRKCATDKVKCEQFERLDPKRPAIVEYLSSVDTADFRTQLKDVAVKSLQEVDGYKGVSSAIAKDMLTVAGKENKVLKALLVDTLAYSSLLRSTGMRSIEGIFLTKESFEKLDDLEGVMVNRMTRKDGSSRNVEKPITVMIVPNKIPALDTLLHLAFHFQNKSDGPLFTAGLTHKAQGRDSFTKMVQRRYVGVLQAVCFALEIPDGLGNSARGDKLLHIFRVMTENVLAGLGASEQSRSNHVGWSNSVQSSCYSAKRYQAKHTVTPFLIAGRDSKDDEPAPLWHFINKIPGSDGLDFWHKARYLDCARKGDPHVDKRFAAEMAKYCQDTTRHRMKTDIKFVAKRMRDAEDEVRQLRAKVAKLELLQPQRTGEESDSSSSTASLSSGPAQGRSTMVRVRDSLKGLVETLKSRNKERYFPRVCNDHFEHVSRLIDAGGTKKRTFCLKLRSKHGKYLKSILLLVALHRKGYIGSSGKSQNWFSYVNAQEKALSNTYLKHVKTDTWTNYRNSLVCLTRVGDTINQQV